MVVSNNSEPTLLSVWWGHLCEDVGEVYQEVVPAAQEELFRQLKAMKDGCKQNLLLLIRSSEVRAQHWSLLSVYCRQLIQQHYRGQGRLTDH